MSMGTNAYIYIPKKETTEKIEEMISGRAYSILGTLSLYPIKRISGEGISFLLSIGRNQEIGFSPNLKKNDKRKKIVGTLVALVIDRSEMNKINDRQRYESLMFEYLNLKREDVEYFGTFQGDSDSLVRE